MLKKGDKCWVRLHGGEIVEAIYDKADRLKKSHWVILENGTDALARPIPTSDTTCGKPDCRFVCMTGIRGKNENQKDQ